MKQFTRRSFLKGSLATATAMGLPVSSYSQLLGANDDIRVAVVGFNGQGKSHIEGFKRLTGVRVVALCDVDTRVAESEAKKFKDRNEPIQTYTDIRKLLENKDIDAISIATPNHWHALAAIWGIQAGKDVYVEKPVSHNVSEGRRIVEAARKHRQIVQTGTQSRSNTGMREAVQFLRDGGLGKIQLARGLCYKRRPSLGKVVGAQLPPASVDYDLWCGPAPKTPLMRSRLHYDWHWVWETGNGDLGNQGIHQMDICRWVLGETELSPAVFSIGGRFGYEDDGTTPNTQIVFHDYKAAPLIFEVRGLPARPSNDRVMDRYRGADVGVVIDCENGFMTMPNYFSATAYDKQGSIIKGFQGEASHHANFIKAVRSRKPSDLNAEILEGHLSSALCHTGNISYRLGSQLSPEEIKEKLQGNTSAEESFNRFSEHLLANGVDLKVKKATFGEMLAMDTKKEVFINNKQANKMLTREYRAPFVVPATV